MAEKKTPKSTIGQLGHITPPLQSTGTRPKKRIPIYFQHSMPRVLARSPVATSSPLPASPQKTRLKPAAVPSSLKNPLQDSFGIIEAERKIKNLTNQLHEIQTHVTNLRINSEQGPVTQEELFKGLISLPGDQLDDLLSKIFDHMDTVATAKFIGMKTPPVQLKSSISEVTRERTPSPITTRSTWRPVTTSESDESFNIPQRGNSSPPSSGLTDTKLVKIQSKSTESADDLHKVPTVVKEELQLVDTDTSRTSPQRDRNVWGDTTQDPWANTSTPYADWGDGFDYSGYQAMQKKLLSNADRSMSDWEIQSSGNHNTSSSVTSDWESEITAYREERRIALERINSNNALPISCMIKTKTASWEELQWRLALDKITPNKTPAISRVVKEQVSEDPNTSSSESRDWDGEIAAYEEEERFRNIQISPLYKSSTSVDSNTLNDQGSSTSRNKSYKKIPKNLPASDASQDGQISSKTSRLQAVLSAPTIHTPDGGYETI